MAAAAPAIVRSLESPSSASPAAGLDWLLAPLAGTEFLDSHWERQPLRLARGNADYFASLLPEGELEFVVTAASQTQGAIEVFNAGARYAGGRHGADAAEALAAGYSVRIDGVQRFSARIAVLARALRQRFSFPVSVNAYLTPPGAQTLSRHFDTHDVFVLQVSGRKRWRVYDSPLASPLEHVPTLHCEREKRDGVERARRQRGHDTGAGRGLLEEFVLEQGDTFYLPRGWFHEAQAEPNAASWHLTVGIHPVTYLELLTVALGQAALRLDGLRCGLRPGFATHARSDAKTVAFAAELARSLPGVLDLEAAERELADAFCRSEGAPPWLGAEGAPASALGVRMETSVRLRPLGACRVRAAAGGERVAMAFDRIELEMPAAFEPALRRIATGAAVEARTLPGEISDSERLALVHKLIEDGLLVTAGPHAR